MMAFTCCSAPASGPLRADGKPKGGLLVASLTQETVIRRCRGPRFKLEGQEISVVS